MPRPNEQRAIQSELAVALRFGLERKRRGMSFEGLAKRMTDEGCPIHASALYKIEQGKPRRRITVDELVAAAAVFELPVQELLVPLPDLVTRDLERIVDEVTAAEKAWTETHRRMVVAQQQLRFWVEGFREKVEEHENSPTNELVEEVLRRNGVTVVDGQVYTKLLRPAGDLQIVDGDEVDHG